MNYYYLVAALLALSTLIIHIHHGRKHYLFPMLSSELDPVVKAVFHCVFHFVSLFILLSTIILAACGFDLISMMQGYGLVLFIALNFGIFAIWQLFLAFDSEIPSPFRRLFQWMPFAGIAILSLVGSYF
ncbi:hypothetical protein [Shewanella woodyi]|uniref:Uncharacterized protein n=1 Tax=Shewanella woodyi (strain ATCC 51908 / MS32) TaxID=392500 RepID=B1KPM9_SHEWM|nr:hypothetical protein [Shewanella woodyi]ACA86182.1 conserved hypothetical protein [Shewanella woodyi ATCC 51908]